MEFCYKYVCAIFHNKRVLKLGPIYLCECITETVSGLFVLTLNLFCEQTCGIALSYITCESCAYYRKISSVCAKAAYSWTYVSYILTGIAIIIKHHRTYYDQRMCWNAMVFLSRYLQINQISALYLTTLLHKTKSGLLCKINVLKSWYGVLLKTWLIDADGECHPQT